MGGTDQTYYREDHRFRIDLAGRTTRVGGKDHIYHREYHRSIVHLEGRTTKISGTDHTCHREGPHIDYIGTTHT